MYPLLGRLHFAAAILALVTGAWVLLRPKGGRLHRRVGWSYVASMLALNATALVIYRLTGTFGPFHVAALVSGGTLVAGVLPAWRRRPRGKWIEHHYFFMTYSYLGLVAAAVAETATRVPAIQSIAGGPTPAFWITVVVASMSVFLVGGRMIRARVRSTLAPFKRPGGVAAVEP